MNTAPVVAPVASREIAPGVTVDTSMTPQQRFDAILKAGVQPEQAGKGHTASTVARMAQGDNKPGVQLEQQRDALVASENAPPSPAALERQNSAPAITAEQEAGIEKLNAAFADKLKTTAAKDARALRAQYQ